MAQDRDKTKPATEGGKHIPKTVAVAIEEQATGAPKITASGRGFLAEQILQVAFANDVKVREDADLTQILSAIDVDSDIPTEAFAAVAEILTYVYRANGEIPPAGLSSFGNAPQ